MIFDVMVVAVSENVVVPARVDDSNTRDSSAVVVHIKSGRVNAVVTLIYTVV